MWHSKTDGRDSGNKTTCCLPVGVIILCYIYINRLLRARCRHAFVQTVRLSGMRSYLNTSNCNITTFDFWQCFVVVSQTNRNNNDDKIEKKLQTNNTNIMTNKTIIATTVQSIVLLLNKFTYKTPPNTCPSSLPHKQNRIKYNILYATTESEKDKQQQNVLELLHMRKQIWQMSKVFPSCWFFRFLDLVSFCFHCLLGAPFQAKCEGGGEEANNLYDWGCISVSGGCSCICLLHVLHNC